MDTLKSIGELAIWIVPTIVAVAAYVKYRVNSRDSHAKTMLELMREFQRTHADAFYSLVERKDTEFYLGGLSFDSSENERKADAMLLFLETILHLHGKGTISGDEFIHFEYYLKRIINDPDFARYLHDFGLTCSDEKAVNPFVHILDYCRSNVAFNERESLGCSSFRNSHPESNCCREGSRASSEDVFIAYLTKYYHGMTRTAKSVKSRVDTHLLKKGWSYENVPTAADLLEAIKSVGADVHEADTAASVRAALRQYYRASFGKEPDA